VLQNYGFIQAGQLSALAAISWVGWCAGLAGNALMCTYLAAKKEAAAVRVQLIGIASNLVVLGQLWWAHVMPTNAFAAALCASVAIAVGGVLRSTGRMSERQWLPFEVLVGAAGVAAAPQVRLSGNVSVGFTDHVSDQFWLCLLNMRSICVSLASHQYGGSSTVLVPRSRRINQSTIVTSVAMKLRNMPAITDNRLFGCCSPAPPACSHCQCKRQPAQCVTVLRMDYAMLTCVLVAVVCLACFRYCGRQYLLHQQPLHLLWSVQQQQPCG
jgi:hypothetical protein